MLDTLKRYFSATADNTAKAETQEEVISMTETKELPEFSAGANTAELTAALATSESALATMQASFAELNSKYTEMSSMLTSLEAAKQNLIDQAAAAKLEKRKESLEFAVGTTKASTLLSVLEVLDDTAFNEVVSALTVNMDAEATGKAFTETGVIAEAKAEVDPVTALANSFAKKYPTK